MWFELLNPSYFKKFSGEKDEIELTDQSDKKVESTDESKKSDADDADKPQKKIKFKWQRDGIKRREKEEKAKNMPKTTV